MSLPLRFFLTAQEFGMVVGTKQMTFLTLDAEWLHFLTHSWTKGVLFPCRAYDLQMAVADSVSGKEYKDAHYYMILHFPSLLVGLFYSGQM